MLGARYLGCCLAAVLVACLAGRHVQGAETLALAPGEFSAAAFKESAFQESSDPPPEDSFSYHHHHHHNRERGSKTLFCWRGAPAPVAGDGALASDRPDFTEASSTVGRGTVQLETGYTYTTDESGGERTTSDSYPETLWRVGMLAEWFEFRLAWNYAHERTRGAVPTDRDGAEDLYLGFKLALTEQQGFLPEMALVPQATVPTGARAFTSDRILPGLNWLYGWDISETFSFAGSTQGNAAQDALGGDYFEAAQSLTIGYSLTERLGGYTEWFALFPHGATEPGLGAEHYFNGGLVFQMTPDLQFDVRAGLGLNERADDLFAGAGLAVRF